MPRLNKARRPTARIGLPMWSLLLLLLPALPVAVGQPAQAEEINRLVLRVNDEILTLFDYEKRKAQEINALLENPNLSPAERQERLGDTPKVVMFGVFREMLLESHASRTGTTVTEREIDATIDSMRQQQGIPDNESLRQALAASGMTMEELRENVRQEILLSQVIRRDVTAKIEVAEDELRAYYRNNSEEFRVPEERRLEEIIVLEEESGLGGDELEQKARAIYDEVQAGAEFSEVAERNQTEGVSTGIIELGWLKKGDLGRLLNDAAWGLEAGQVSQPVDGRGGYHLLHLLEAKGGELLPYNQVEERILTIERNRRFGKELNEFMAELAETSYIVEDIPPEAIGYRALSDFTGSGDDELAGFRGPLRAAAAEGVADDGTADAGAEMDGAMVDDAVDGEMDGDDEMTGGEMEPEDGEASSGGDGSGA